MPQPQAFSLIPSDSVPCISAICIPKRVPARRILKPASLFTASTRSITQRRIFVELAVSGLTGVGCRYNGFRSASSWNSSNAPNTSSVDPRICDCGDFHPLGAVCRQDSPHHALPSICLGTGRYYHLLAVLPTDIINSRPSAQINLYVP